jgi:hypothetical protein
MEKVELIDISYMQKYLNVLASTTEEDNKREAAHNLLYIAERIAAVHGVKVLYDRQRASE